MFFVLHRIIIAGFYGLLVALGLYVYQQREAFRPLVDLFTLWKQSDPKPSASLGEISGQVTRILDGGTFQIKDAQGIDYVVSLTGIEIPRLRNPRDAIDRAIAAESKTNLTRLILGRPVRTDLTYTNAIRTGLGLVFLEQTNINVKVLESGMARLNREFIKSLPLKQQYQLLAAQRRAQARKLGVWKD